MRTQFTPSESQRFHWYANVGAGKPLHVPAAAVSVEPTLAVPVMVGSAVFAGTVPTAKAPALAVCPSGFVIVTVFVPAPAPTVDTFSVTCVASVNVTELTVTPPSIDAAIRQVPEP